MKILNWLKSFLKDDYGGHVNPPPGYRGGFHPIPPKGKPTGFPPPPPPVPCNIWVSEGKCKKNVQDVLIMLIKNTIRLDSMAPQPPENIWSTKI